MNAEEFYRWFEEAVKEAIPQADTRLTFSYEPTVTPEVFLAKIAPQATPNKAWVRSDVRPEGVRLHFPLDWADELSEWLGAPPAEAYRLKSNWVHQPSIGVGVADFDPYFKQLAAKVIEMIKARLV